MIPRHALYLTVLLVSVAAGTPLSSQATTGVAIGRITDPAGLAVPASVSVVGTGARTFTRPDGGFTLCDIPLGRVQLAAIALGFAPRVSEVTLVTGIDTVLWFPSLLSVPLVLDSIRIAADKADSLSILVLLDSLPHAARQLGRCGP